MLEPFSTWSTRAKIEQNLENCYRTDRNMHLQPFHNVSWNAPGLNSLSPILNFLNILSIQYLHFVQPYNKYCRSAAHVSFLSINIYCHYLVFLYYFRVSSSHCRFHISCNPLGVSVFLRLCTPLERASSLPVTIFHFDIQILCQLLPPPRRFQVC